MTKQVYTLDDLRQWESIAPKLNLPAKLAVIGDPIAHSRSPQMHNPALAARGIRGQYIRVQVRPGSVAEALGLFAQNGFAGVNCTIPHKFEALEAVHEVDDLAAKLGAVNTVAIRGSRLHGYNSDGPGFVASVQEAFGRGLDGLRVLILGAGGGAGRAVAVQCALGGCAWMVLMNRTPEKAEAIRTELMSPAFGSGQAGEVEVMPWRDDALKEVLPTVNLIVNASPRGMKPDDAQLFDPALLQPGHLVYDMVYRSRGSTPLITAAKSVGARTCDGLVLLLHQGAISFGHWFGEPVPVEVMRRALLES